MVLNLPRRFVYLFLHINRGNFLKRFFTFLLRTFLVLILLLILAWGLVQTTPVQNWLVGKVTHRLSKDLKTNVSIKKVDFALFNRMLLEGTLIEDLNRDTLLYAGTLKVNITDWFFVRSNIELKYIGLDNASIYLHRKDSTWNYQFIANYFGSASSTKTKKKKNIQLDIREIDLTNTTIIQRDEWRGEDLTARLASMEMNAREISFAKRIIDINSLILRNPFFSVYQYDGLRPDSLRPKRNDSVAMNSDELQWNPDNWLIKVANLGLREGQFKHDLRTERGVYASFDPNHIHFTTISGRFRNFKWEQDTISGKAALHFEERSGFTVDTLRADIKFFPKGMFFSDLDIRTPKSRLKNYFAMEYENFNDDMIDFERRVRLTGNFEDAVIDSDDIAFFAPELKSWKKKLKVSGNVSGRIENLKGRNLLVEAGKNTSLNGDLTISGLPYIERTYIDFKARDFRTTSEDAMLIVPQLKTITQPNIQSIEWLQFQGNFTGFIRDFVTYGTIRTNLGSITSDVNMKLPENSVARYSGNLSANSFHIGKFLNVPQLGTISFSSKLKGTDFELKNINADLDAKIQSLEANGYTYTDIAAKGTLSRKKFNGWIQSLDSNLVFHLNGLVDFSNKIPRFDFDALVQKADLKKLGFSRKPFDFTGSFALNFEGDDIDNFLGEARIYNASAYVSGKRISFDSLNLSSRIIDDYKTLVLKSNELDAAIVGKYSVRDMPAAVSQFLSIYYPSYVKAPRRLSTDEDFSFVVKTKSVDEYISLLDLGISGFDNSAFSGRINSAQNIFTLDADIPSFNIGDVGFSGLVLKGNGDLNALNLHTVIGNTVVNDSLYFPETSITIASRNDTSNIAIKATANQTFNTANISAKVITLSDGVQIVFNASNFDINGKTWAIDRNGELILRKNQLNSSNLRIYQDLQEITVSTEPSDIGYTNDLRVDLANINIGDFAPFFITSNRLEGVLHGTVRVADPFGKLSAETDLNIEQFRLDNDSIGNIRGNANYMLQSGMINFLAEADNKDYTFDISGSVNTKDTTQQEIDILADVRNTRVNLLQQYLTGIFSKIEGKATGKLRIRGSGDNLVYTGPVTLTNAMLKVDYTQVEYRLPTTTIQFTEEGIDFGKFVVYDRFGDSARGSGSLAHNNFSDMRFNLNLNANRLELLNTFAANNPQFYGQARGRATMSITGPESDIRMNLRAEPTDSSHIFIPSSSTREGGSADFIVWKVYGREMNANDAMKKESNFTLDMDVTANNLLSIDMILDDLTGDVIKATGKGIVNFHIGTRDRFTMNGRYEIDRGEYNFSFQTLVRKPFTLRPGAGNYIQWNGDPYEADIKIDAEYTAQNVRFSDLISSQNSALLGDPNIRKYRGDVYVIAELRGSLNRPDIRFNFDFPTNMPFRNDLAFTQALELIKQDNQELNKQVTYLVVFNSFAPFSSNNVDVGASFVEGVVVNTISGIFSNTLSKEFNSVLQKIFKDETLKVNISTSFYNGSNIILENSSSSGRSGLVIDRSNFNLSVGKSILNDRLTFTFGSELDFGLSTMQQAQLNFQFLPDLNAEWKITPDGRVRATFFTRNSYDFYVGRQRNRSGASISVRREFETLGDLLRKRKDSSAVK